MCPQLDVRIITGGNAKNLRSYTLSVITDLLSADINRDELSFCKGYC